MPRPRSSTVGRLAALAAAALTLTETGAPAADEAPEFRVLSYNIHHGEGTDGKLDLGRIARVISDHRPDVVALQEVDVSANRTGKVDQPAELARLTGMKPYFIRSMDYDGGEYGLCLLTRDEPLRKERIELPKSAEPRVAGLVALRWEGLEVVVVNTHLDATEREAREPQARKIAETFGHLPSPVIVTGDFNSVRGDPVLTLFEKEGWEVPEKSGTPATVPAGTPRREIDFAILKPPGSLRFAEYRTVEQPVASDHRPVLAVFRKP